MTCEQNANFVRLSHRSIQICTNNFFFIYFFRRFIVLNFTKFCIWEWMTHLLFGFYWQIVCCEWKLTFENNYHILLKKCCQSISSFVGLLKGNANPSFTHNFATFNSMEFVQWKCYYLKSQNKKKLSRSSRALYRHNITLNVYTDTPQRTDN